MIATLFVFVVVLLACLHFTKKRNGFLPPGPPGLPLVGHLLQQAVGEPMHLQRTEWAKQYGKLYTIYLGSKPVVVLNELDVMKDILGRMAATGRNYSEIVSMLMWSGPYGLLRSEGREWQEQKQFCMRALREFGFGRQALMEPLIVAEAEKLCRWIDGEIRMDSNTLLLNEHIAWCTGSIMWSMVTGKPEIKPKLEAPRIAQLLANWTKILSVANKWGLTVFPWVKYIAPAKSGYQAMVNMCKEVREYVEHHFEKHGRTRAAGEPPRDMIDAYIEKVETCQDKGSTFYGDTGWKHSFASLVTLMLASTDSTGHMLTWVIYCLCAHPRIQLAVQREIDLVLGGNQPGYADMENMPYLKAVILETLRFRPFAPAGSMVKLLKDVSAYGYHLPKGTLISPNIYAVNNDKTIWGDPENFRPDRFLEEGREYLKDFVVTFQVGKRSCLGERFAKDVLCIFAAKLFQSYTFSPDPSLKTAEQYLKSTQGVTLKPKKLKVVVTPRSANNTQ